jgi:hypothetical protein
MIKNIIIFLLFLPLFAGMYYLNQVVWILEFTLWIISYSFIFYLFHIIWRKIRKKEILIFSVFLQKFLLSMSSLLVISTLLFWYFWYYQTILNPLSLQQHTVSNWKKTLVFQEMIHIWSEQYYQNIATEISKHKNKDYVYYFEWVKRWSQKNMDKFDLALGIEFDEKLYKNLAATYWLIPQNNEDFLNLVNDRDINVDQNIDEIIQKYEELKVTKNTKNITPNKPINVNKDIVDMLAELEWRELELLQFINKSMLSLLTKNEEFLQIVQKNFWNQELFEILLEWRNITVADKIIHSEDKLIFATYWALHYEWVLKLLQENDPNWKVTQSKKFYPFQ